MIPKRRQSRIDGNEALHARTCGAVRGAMDLEPMLGHLRVDDRGMPRRNDGAEAAPGLRFIGFRPLPALPHFVGVAARRIARAIAKELRRGRRARRAISPQTAGRAPAA